MEEAYPIWQVEKRLDKTEERKTQPDDWKSCYSSFVVGRVFTNGFDTDSEPIFFETRREKGAYSLNLQLTNNKVSEEIGQKMG